MSNLQPETPTVKGTVDARQGRRGTGVRNVLVAGLLLVIVAFAAVYWYHPT